MSWGGRGSEEGEGIADLTGIARVNLGNRWPAIVRPWLGNIVLVAIPARSRDAQDTHPFAQSAWPGSSGRNAQCMRHAKSLGHGASRSRRCAGCRIRPTLTDVGQFVAGVGQTLPGIALSRTLPVELGQSPGPLWSAPSQHMPNLANFEQCWPTFGHHWPNSASILPTSYCWSELGRNLSLGAVVSTFLAACAVIVGQIRSSAESAGGDFPGRMASNCFCSVLRNFSISANIGLPPTSQREACPSVLFPAVQAESFRQEDCRSLA